MNAQSLQSKNKRDELNLLSAKLLRFSNKKAELLRERERERERE